jgi:N-acetyl-gamma-glutamyl-phosphate reductase
LINGIINTDGIIVDSKSGTTGAGRGLSQNLHYADCNEAFAPYKVGAHRHTPEIEQALSKAAGKDIKITFVPHLLPINRGIISTIYADLKTDFDTAYNSYYEFYKDEKFIRLHNKGDIANLRDVRMSNYCDISLHYDKHTNKLIIVSAIDNMVKGAAGQAIQNMNLVCGFKEDEGLDIIPPAF